MKIIFTGDFYPVHLNSVDPKEVYGKFYNQFNHSDLFVTNFEGSLDNTYPRQKQGPNLFIDPKYLDLLKLEAGIVCCLANNHSFDFGNIGLAKTCNLLEYYGFACLGVLPEPLIVDGVALFNMCENEGGQGFIFTWDMLELVKQVLECKAETKIVILHGGNEGFPYPNPYQQYVSRYLVDLGVDLIVWHHNHVPSAYETYKGKSIYYGLGNFLFKNNFSSYGYFVKMDTEAEYTEHTGYTITDNDIQPYKLQPMLDTLNSKSWNISWAHYSKEMFIKYTKWLKDFINNDKDIDLLNFFECESHRRLIIDGIKVNNSN